MQILTRALTNEQRETLEKAIKDRSAFLDVGENRRIVKYTPMNQFPYKLEKANGDWGGDWMAEFQSIIFE